MYLLDLFGIAGNINKHGMLLGMLKIINVKNIYYLFNLLKFCIFLHCNLRLIYLEIHLYLINVLQTVQLRLHCNMRLLRCFSGSNPSEAGLQNILINCKFTIFLLFYNFLYIFLIFPLNFVTLQLLIMFILAVFMLLLRTAHCAQRKLTPFSYAAKVSFQLAL